MCSLLGYGCQHSVSPDVTLSQIREQMRRGQLELAQRNAEAAIAVHQSKNPEWAARFRIVKARILMIRGSYADSLQLVNPALPAALQRTDAEVEREMVQGLDYDYLQQLDAADHAIAQAESLAAAIQSSWLGSVSLSRGILELDRGHNDKAAAAFRAAANFAREHNQSRSELDAVGNLGYVAMLQEHYDEAMDDFQRALTLSRSLSAVDAESRSLGNLGWSHWVIGDLDSALQDLTQAHEKAAQAALDEDQTYWLASLADVEAMQSRFAEADVTGRKALALAEKHDDQRTLASCLEVLARVALFLNHLDEAEQFNHRAADIVAKAGDQPSITDSQLIAGRIAAAKGNYADAIASFQNVILDRKTETRLKWEAHTRLAEAHAAQHQPARAEPEFRTAVQMVQQVRDSITSKERRVSFLSTAIEFYDSYVNFLIDQRRPLDALAVADLSRSQASEEGLSSKGKAASKSAVSPPLPNLQDVARRQNATLLFYWLGRQKSWFWVITPAKTSLIPLSPAGELQALVDAYRKSFVDDPRDPLESGNADGKKLFATLIQPAEKLLPQMGRVILLPDGALNSLNFETLIVSEPAPHYWIDDATLLSSNSIAALARRTTSPPAAAARRLLVLGDAVAASPEFPPLPQAGAEIRNLEKYFNASQRTELTGKAATPRAFLASSPEKFSYLHFATHGTASRLRPLESAVILSPDSDSAFKLYARDVVQHPLSADLVTISACNGAGTKTYAGEGLVGLSWAFLHAGARNVIAGLWEVSNASTPALMDELYRGLNSGQDPATALRNAKLTLVHSTGNYRKPFYWAPFLLYSGS